MTKDDIIHMAQSAGVSWGLGISGMEDFLERFANLVAAHEREECVKVCEKVAEFHQVPLDSDFALDLTSAIKARGIKLRGKT